MSRYESYDRDEYEDLDEYEEEDDDQEDEKEEVGEEEEDPEPTKEALEYLEYRQRLKENIRKKIKKESGSANSQEKKKKPTIDNFGSFFGPSQPVIAQRVIQESKSLLENRHLASKVTKSHNSTQQNNKSFASNTARSEPRANKHPPKVVNELRSKVQKLKDTRDYSFLLSDDVDPPAPRKDPPSRNLSVPHSEARSAQVPPKSKQSSSSAGRHVRNDREERKPLNTNIHMQKNKTGSHKLASAGKPNLTPVDSRKQLGSNYGNGPGRPPAPKSVPLKTPAATNEKKVYAPVAKSSVASSQKVSSSKLHSSVPKHQLEQRKQFQESSKEKMMPKQPMSSSKAQINKPPPKASSRAILQDDRPKKKPARGYSREDDDSDDGGKAISMIRRMFNYNPRKYTDREDDDSDMEANFDDILREEKRSAKIAKREDEEELRKIEEEERRERLRKEAKKRKLS